MHANATIPRLFIGAGIDDLLGHRLATFESNEVQFGFGAEPGKDYVLDLTIPQPYLNPGRYFLSVSLFSGQQYYDVLFHAAAFEIVPIHAETGDFFEAIPGA